MELNKHFKFILVILSISFVLYACKNKTKVDNETLIIQEKPFKKGNPIVYDVGMADPHIKIFNNKAYLYATRDEDKLAKDFIMSDWKIWSSKNLIHWTLETTIAPTETYMGESKSCWASDAAYKNGNYYFYFSNGNTDTGVLVGKTPSGPFKDVLGKPMLPKNLTPTKEYDPTILIDDDDSKSAYIAFGHHRSSSPDYYFMIAKLNEDMISLAEKPREIKITGNAKVLGGNDKPTLHKFNGKYYLSAGSHYAISDNIYGPYVKTGNSGNNKYGLNSRAHGNYFDWNNQSFHTWCHFYLGKDVARYRESYISYLHYKNNGEMVTDTNFLKNHFSMGVGQYDANWKKIEAEWYMKADKTEKKENPNGGFEIQNIKNNGWLYFPNIYNIENKEFITLLVSSIENATVEIRANSSKGKLLGICNIEPTGSWTNYKEAVCNLSNTKGVKNIYFKFRGNSTDILHLDWFSFNSTK